MVDKINKGVKKLEKKSKETPRQRKIRLEKIKKLREKTKEYNQKFRNELKKSVLTAIVAAFGFLMALSWREFILVFIEKINGLSPVQGQLVKVMIITFISVLGIIVATKLLSNSESS